MNNNPLSMREAAIGMHEMLVSLLEVGFTREEAIYLIGSMVNASSITNM